ncbi:MAG: ABC transporter substrate-binding protein [Proteobacteria bacterium]|nr:ABC transporter substrate-binding protein [Pseudomonadota bacterium]
MSNRGLSVKRWLIAMTALLGCLLAPSCRCSRERAEKPGYKVFYYRNDGKGKSHDPQMQYDTYSANAVALVFDSLYGYHYLKRPYELVPNLAAALPTYSEDGRTMRISLRSDVTFHDDICFAGGRGRAFKASDVVYTMNRFADVNVNDKGSVTLIEGLIVGLDDFVKKSKATPGKMNYDQDFISGVRALDDHTIEISLTKPTTVVFTVLANRVLSIVPKECVDHYGLDFGFHPVGTGPFTIGYKNRKGDVILKKYARYHLKYPSEGEPGDLEKGLLKDAGRALPIVDEVVLPVIEENQPAMLKFLRGDLDWVRLDGDSFRDIAVKSPDGSFSLKPPYDKRFSLYPAVDLSAFWWVFNMKDAVVGKNRKLRLAMAHAFNSKGFVEDIYNGRGQVVESMVPSSIAGNSKDVGVSWYPYDPVVAKKLLAEAGYPGGEGLAPIVLTYSSMPTIQRIYEYLRRDLAVIGIKLELETAPYTSYVEKFAKGGFQFSIGGWNADYIDAENFLMLFTKEAVANELYYGGGWSHPEYEDLFKQIKELRNGPERFALIKRMMELVKADAPYIPQFTYNRIGLYAPWLKNWKRNMADEREAVFVDIDQERRAKGSEP